MKFYFCNNLQHINNHKISSTNKRRRTVIDNNKSMYSIYKGKDDIQKLPCQLQLQLLMDHHS